MKLKLRYITVPLLALSLLLFVVVAHGISLTDIPNSSAFGPQVKSILRANNVLHETEIANSRFTDDGYSFETHLDPDLRDESGMLEVEEEEGDLEEGDIPEDEDDGDDEDLNEDHLDDTEDPRHIHHIKDLIFTGPAIYKRYGHTHEFEGMETTGPLIVNGGHIHALLGVETGVGRVPGDILGENK